MAAPDLDSSVPGSNALPPRDLTGRYAVAGLFYHRVNAEQAIHDLKAAGFAGNAIGVAIHDPDAQGAFVEETSTQAAEGATTGALGGGLLGGLAGFLVGIGALALPGIGPIVAGGALAAAFGIAGGTAVVGAGLGAAAGGFMGALIGMGIPETEARHFETGFRSGGTLIVINAGERVQEAIAILENNGADTGSGKLDTVPLPTAAVIPKDDNR